MFRIHSRQNGGLHYHYEMGGRADELVLGFPCVELVPDPWAFGAYTFQPLRSW